MAAPDRPEDRNIPRFYLAGPLPVGSEVVLPEQAARHVGVLRLRAGDALALFNGAGGEYQAELADARRDHCTVRILGFEAIEREAPFAITLALCLSAGDRMDLSLQKATELGVAAIVPLASERSVVRLSPERAQKRLEHWRHVAIAACEQCGRNRVPEVQPLAELLPWLAQPAGDGLRLLLDPETGSGLASLPAATPRQLLLLVGAEGGFAAQERDAARRAGFRPLSLGPRVLRTETAPLAAIAALQALWGDFR